MTTPSKNHTNRKAYNWLLYDQSDKYLIEYIPHYKGIMLDLGCADKPFESFFKQYVDEYIGVDWSNTIHNSKADIVSDLNKKINLEDNYADTIVSLNVLEHLCEPQVFLNECYRLLKDDGTLILHIPFQWWIHEQPYDYFRYTPYGLKYMLNKSGFTDIQVQPTSGFYTTIFMKINYFTLRLIHGSKLKQKFITLLLNPFWYISQKLAPKLDSMHRGWSLEAQSFFVVAQKKEKEVTYRDEKIIASLTTYGMRINSVELTIKSLLEQEKKADKILLWLAEDEFNLNNIPKNLKNLHENKLIEIKFYKDIKSYKKLIPTLELHKNDIIITFDDDIIYHKSLIKKLYEEHLNYPNTVICARGHKIEFDSKQNIMPYSKWSLVSDKCIESYDIFPTGAGGVLYPPNCFYKDILKEELFLSLAPNADDIWFKAMTLKNNRKSKILSQNNKEFANIFTIEGTQENSLYHTNIFKGLNDKYIKNIFKLYNLNEKVKNII
jgi:SAM-dependent methyltransferase